MDNETYYITTIIENIKILNKTIFNLIPIKGKYFIFKIADKDYCRIDTGILTDFRKFTMVLILKLTCLTSHIDFIFPTTIKDYSSGEHTFLLDNENSRLFCNGFIIPYNNQNGLNQLQTQDNTYPIVTSVKFVTTIERSI